MLLGRDHGQEGGHGRVRHAAEILNFVGSGAETAVIDNVREYDPELAQKILDEMFVFENLSTSTTAASSPSCARCSPTR